MQIEAEVKVNKALKALMKQRPKAIGFAWDRTTFKAAKLLKELLIRQWARDVKVRRRTFPRTALVARYDGRSKVAGNSVVRLSTGQVFNKFGDEVFNLALKGGVSRPHRAKNILVPVGSKKITRSTKRNAYVRGNVLWKTTKGKGGDKALGTLHPSVEVPKYWHIDLPIQRIRRVLPRMLERELRKEILEIQRRNAGA